MKPFWQEIAQEHNDIAALWRWCGHAAGPHRGELKGRIDTCAWFWKLVSRKRKGVVPFRGSRAGVKGLTDLAARMEARKSDVRPKPPSRVKAVRRRWSVSILALRGGRSQPASTTDVDRRVRQHTTAATRRGFTPSPPPCPPCLAWKAVTRGRARWWRRALNASPRQENRPGPLGPPGGAFNPMRLFLSFPSPDRGGAVGLTRLKTVSPTRAGPLPTSGTSP